MQTRRSSNILLFIRYSAYCFLRYLKRSITHVSSFKKPVLDFCF